jgi:hypothetical protein
MGLDNELRVSITADTEGLQGGLAEAQSEVESSAGSLAAAQARLAAATANLRDMEAALTAHGVNLNDVNNAAGPILATLRQEATAAAAAVEALAAADQTAAVAANQAAAGATRAAEAFQQQGVSAQVAALGGIKVMEGSMMGSSRAAAAFLSNTLGLGGVLAAAFPVIGALALGMVVVDLGEEIVKFSKEASDLSDIMNSSWLDGAVAALTGLGDALKEDKKQLESWEGVYDKVIAKEKQDEVRDAEAKGGRSAGLRAEIQQLQQKANEQDRIAANLKSQLASEKELAETGAGKEILTQLKEHPFSTIMSAGQSAIGKASADAARDAEAIKAVEKQAEDYRLEIHRKTLQAMEVDEKAFAAAQKKENRPEKAGKQSSEVKDYFENEKRNLEDYTRRIQEDTRQQEEMLTRPFEAMTRESENTYRLAEEADKHQTEAFKHDHEEQIALAKENAEAEIKGAADLFEETKRNIDDQVELGRISHKTASQMLQDALALKNATVQGANLKVAVLFDPIMGGKETEDYKRFQAKMTADAHKGDQEREAIVKKESQQFEKSWKVATDAFNSDFTGAMNSWMTHSETAGKAFGSMLGDMERQTIDFVAKNLLEHAEMWAMLEIMSMTGTTTLLTQQEAAAALQKMSDAKTAAANAYAWGSSWGGPVAGGIAAAVAFTAVEAFDYGGMVRGMPGSPVPIIAHAGESVLTASQTQNFRSMTSSTNQSSARASNVALHYNPVIHGNADAGMLQEHSRQMLSQVRKMVRPEALS